MPDASFLVAEENGAIVGHILATAQKPPFMTISRLYVRPIASGAASGQAHRCSRQPGTKTAIPSELEVEADNKKGLSFYLREGFHEVEPLSDAGDRSHPDGEAIVRSSRVRVQLGMVIRCRGFAPRADLCRPAAPAILRHHRVGLAADVHLREIALVAEELVLPGNLVDDLLRAADEERAVGGRAFVVGLAGDVSRDGSASARGWRNRRRSTERRSRARPVSPPRCACGR